MYDTSIVQVVVLHSSVKYLFLPQFLLLTTVVVASYGCVLKCATLQWVGVGMAEQGKEPHVDLWSLSLSVLQLVVGGISGCQRQSTLCNGPAMPTRSLVVAMKPFNP